MIACRVLVTLPKPSQTFPCNWELRTSLRQKRSRAKYWPEPRDCWKPGFFSAGHCWVRTRSTKGKKFFAQYWMILFRQRHRWRGPISDLAKSVSNAVRQLGQPNDLMMRFAWVVITHRQ